MANRFSQISTSSFKPLSLEEIMAVPLSKQAQHDEASLALDEFALLEANSLDADKEYVKGQIGALQKESDVVSNQLLDSGVNRDLTNKVKMLRNRKNKEFSLTGKTGQASAAYNQYQANKESINKRVDLRADQKEAGLNRAKNNYLGVENGGVYEDYVGTANIDIMAKGREIASKMSPIEKAEALGMTWDEENGFYVDGESVHRELTSEHIQQVVYQGLKADGLVTEFANELQSLDLGDADKMIRESAVNAGNVYKISYSADKDNYRAGGKNNRKFDDSQTLRNPMDWSTKEYSTIQEKTYNQYAINPLPDSAYDDKGYISDDFYETKEKMKGRHEKEMATRVQQVLSTGIGSTASLKETHYKQMQAPNEKEQQVKRIGEFRDHFKFATEGMNDKEVYQIYSKLQENASAYISEIGFPENPESTFNYIKERILGEGSNYGDIMSGARQFHIPGDDRAMTAAEIAKEYKVTEVEMADMMKKGTIGGISAYDPELPMGFALQFSPDGETMQTVIVSNDVKLARLNKASRMTKNMLEGKSFDVEKIPTRENNVYAHYVLKLTIDRDEDGNIVGQRYEPYIMYAKEEMKRTDLEGRSIEDLEKAGIEVDTLTETARNEMEKVQSHYDTIINKKTLK
tara:strand:+ start:22138 stop:24033 length:1896 start_codon:yes stop_codon:yes gene_type:complete